MHTSGKVNKKKRKKNTGDPGRDPMALPRIRPNAAELVGQRPPHCPFPRWVGREDESVSRPGHRCNFGNGNIGWAASPPRVLVEGPAGRLKAHFLDELVGALNERLNILLCAHSAGHDGLIRTRERFLGTKTRRGKQEGGENQGIRQSMLHDGETNKSASRVARSASFEGRTSGAGLAL